MGTQRRIVIKRNPAPPPRVVFDPDPFPAEADDEIFWFNDDSEPHWPAPLDADGTILDAQAFMDFQIPSKNSSPTVNPASDVEYGCSLHLSADGKATERGLIKFS